MDPERIVAVGLLTQRDVNLLGLTFERLWPVEEAPSFEELLRAIDEADRKLGQRDEDRLQAAAEAPHRRRSRTINGLARFNSRRRPTTAEFGALPSARFP